MLYALLRSSAALHTPSMHDVGQSVAETKMQMEEEIELSFANRTLELK